ncbi:MAG: hypothetical protein RIM84_25890 [Alphaproteobacteria bacterium]
MDIDAAGNQLVEAGKSEALIEAFRAIADSTGADGEPRYSRRVVRTLARMVSCRAYGRAVFELCHLINIADAVGEGRDRWERFFFAAPRASTAGFRGQVEDALARRDWRREGFRLTGDAVAIAYAGKPFAVNFARMPVLAALLEFLVATVGYGAVADILAELLTPPVAEAAVGRAANALQAQLYRYLADHLPSVQHMAKFNRLLSYLRERSDGTQASLDDDAVLEFWRQAAAEPETDFRAYRTAFDAAVQLVRALQAAGDQQAMARARPIGTDREAGEVDPAVIAELLDAQTDAWESPMVALDSPPADAVKFLNKAETEVVAMLLDCGPVAGRLPVSLLRAEVFGRHQGRITQALRRGSDVAALAREAPQESYEQRLACWAELRRHIARLLSAAAHVLLPDVANDDRALAEKLTQGRRAFRGLSRKGFEEAGDPATVEAFRAAIAPLTAIDDQIDTLSARLSGDAAPDFQADVNTFASAFMELYEVRP